MGDGQEGLAGAGRPKAEHQLALAEGVEVLGLGGGLGGHLPAAADRQVRRAGRAGPRTRLADGDADVRLLDLQALVGAIGDGLHRLLGLAARLGVAGQRDPAAGRLDQHAERVLDQGGVTAVGARHRADGGVGQGDEFGSSAQAVSSSSTPARLFWAALSTFTGTIWPNIRSGAVTWTAWR